MTASDLIQQIGSSEILFLADVASAMGGLLTKEYSPKIDIYKSCYRLSLFIKDKDGKHYFSQMFRFEQKSEIWTQGEFDVAHYDL